MIDRSDRWISLDTETTGLSPEDGDRVVEIGCVEMNGAVRGSSFHVLLDPEGRIMPDEVVAVHGHTNASLIGKQKFAEIADDFLSFIGDLPLVIHNAGFDIGFLNAELARCRRSPIQMVRVVDSLQEARRRYPNRTYSLDALCKQLGIDNSHRKVHGALLDAELLSDVFVEMMSFNRLDLAPPKLARKDEDRPMAATRTGLQPHGPRRPGRPAREDELARHMAFMKSVKEPVWDRYAQA